MKTTVIGAHPKISDEPSGQELRRALHRQDRGELDDAGLVAVFDDATRSAIGEIESAGIDVTNDGQVRWDDLLAPFARAWQGVNRGALERFYDNNTYFRQPVIEGAIASDGNTLVRDLTFARSVARGELKAAACGPLTFAALATDRHYKTFEERVLAVADALASEITSLGRAGAKLIDVEDPAIVATPQHAALARRAYERLAASNVPLAVQTYFFPADRVLDELAKFPVAQVGIDLRSRETKALDRLKVLPQIVVLGVVDARNTRLERPDEVARTVDAALRAVDAARLWLAPTTGLEYLPHDIALKKLSALVAGTRAAGGVTA